MAIVVPNEAERNILKLILETNLNVGSIPEGDMYIHLYTSESLILGESTTLVDLKAAEITEAQYPELITERVITSTDWGYANSTDGIATAAEKVLILRNDSDPFFIHGYFITKGVDIASGVLMWAESFPAPFSIPNGGSTLKLTLRLELD